MENNKIELLAPVGNINALKAAVQNGADAVYLGGSLFNARQNADNFSEEELIYSIDYAHLRDVSVYLTLNTLIDNDYMEKAFDLACFAYREGVDAVIVQDFGLAHVINKHLPKLPLHASTQMTMHNIDGIKFLEQCDFDRVVLARELSLKDMHTINKHSSIATEIFVHGALCVSYSGQCLLSFIHGGRSGNKGTCAQPCRLLYNIANDNSLSEKGYFLSPKDLCGLSLLPEYIKAGISSLKVEGRMKTPEYVAGVVSVYRKYIDLTYELIEKNNGFEFDFKSSINDLDTKKMMQLFNRGCFTTAYPSGTINKNMMCYDNPKNTGLHLGHVLSYDFKRRTIKLKLHESLSIGDGVEVISGNDRFGNIVTRIIKAGQMVKTAEKGDLVYIGDIKGNIQKGLQINKTSDKRLNQEMKKTFEKDYRKVALNGTFTVQENHLAELETFDNENNHVTVTSDSIIEPAISRVTSQEDIKTALLKTGNSVYSFENLNIEIIGKPSIRKSTLNQMRRNALEALNDKRIQRHKKNEVFSKLPICEISSKTVNTEISLYFYKINNTFDLLKLKASRVFINIAHTSKDIIINTVKKKDSKKQVFLSLPTIIKDTEWVYYKDIITKSIDFIDGIEINNIGQYNLIKDYNKLIHAGQGINITNNRTLNFLCSLNIASALISPEVPIEAINAFNSCNIKTEYIVDGPLQIMTMETCPISSFNSGVCKNKHNSNKYTETNFHLLDRKGEKFPIISYKEFCRNMLLSPPINLAYNKHKKKRAFNYSRINIIENK